MNKSRAASRLFITAIFIVSFCAVYTMLELKVRRTVTSNMPYRMNAFKDRMALHAAIDLINSHRDDSVALAKDMEILGQCIAHQRITMATMVAIYPNWRRERLPNPPPGCPLQDWPIIGSARTWNGQIMDPPKVRK